MRKNEIIEVQTKIVPLTEVKVGAMIRIQTIPGGITRAQFIRMGLVEGLKVKCLERLPGGTIVLQKRRQQIAIGHQLARQILVNLDGREEGK